MSVNQDLAKNTDQSFRLCPSCGFFEEHDSGKIYCSVCGMRLLEKCPECYAPIYYPTAKFCPACGGEYIAGRADSSLRK